MEIVILDRNMPDTQHQINTSGERSYVLAACAYLKSVKGHLYENINENFININISEFVPN